MSTTLLVPVLDEAKALPALVARFAELDPRPAEILLVDGGSADETVQIAKDAGWRILFADRGRAKQINAGVEAATSENLCVVHADTLPPCDMVEVIENTLSDRRIALASFTPVIRGPEKTRWGTTVHNWAKTWYAPLLTRPHRFFQGVRLLFGDHAMFFRRADFLTIGGCTPGDAVMEEADLCVKFARLGKVRMVPRKVYTSDRRIAEWGALKANWIYFKVGMLWAFGLRSRMAKHYPDVR
ncbi:glycosyltransferase [Erythrobacter aquimaris]|uniref:Glycosyltransferase n=1 Tax=Qipengyuania aquimaris TaxID=255984 RepID=A0A6I4TN78_9SPHN|nr:glycosyltransferase [Qipengyuania aquimaris]MXO96477.1 glycosyltransferase [Qipengyuania aquimaris]